MRWHHISDEKEEKVGGVESAENMVGEKKELLMTHTKEVKYSFVGSFDTKAAFTKHL